MSHKIITHWDGVLHILRNPYGFTEDTVRQARLDAADRLEALERENAALREALQRFMVHPANDGLGDDKELIEACRAARKVFWGGQ